MNKLISYKKAPLVEVVVGIQLSKEAITSEFIFEFYQLSKNKFPKIQEHPPLPFQIENKDSNAQLGLPNGISSRKFFIESEGNRLIQLQHNRIVFNWRVAKPDDQYPHYDSVIKEFYGIIEQVEKKVPIKLLINQLEFSYVNHMVLEDFGLDSLQVSNIIKFINFPNPLKTINCNLSLWEPELEGNIIAQLKSAKRNRDDKKILIYETTCRGVNKNGQSVEQWFDQAHQKLLQLFENSITDKAKSIWQKQH
jgi:uncharacterized protein (TIGR04255 family)